MVGLAVLSVVSGYLTHAGEVLRKSEKVNTLSEGASGVWRAGEVVRGDSARSFMSVGEPVTTLGCGPGGSQKAWVSEDDRRFWLACIVVITADSDYFSQ